MCNVGTEATAGLAPYTASDIKPPNRTNIPPLSHKHVCQGKLGAEERRVPYWLEHMLKMSANQGTDG